MKKHRKKIIYGLLISTFLFISGIVYIYETSINKVLSQEQQQFLIFDISSTEPLPDSFYDTMEKYHSGYFDNSTWDVVFLRFFRSKTPCPCKDMYMPIVPGTPLEEKGWVPFGQYDIVIALFVEYEFTQFQCFSYDMRRLSEFGNNIDGVEDAALEYYGKSLEELNEREIIALELIRQAPSQYNPRTNSEVLNFEVEKILRQ